MIDDIYIICIHNKYKKYVNALIANHFMVARNYLQLFEWINTITTSEMIDVCKYLISANEIRMNFVSALIHFSSRMSFNKIFYRIAVLICR